MLKNGQILKETYRIEEMIGSGGGGTVYKAWHIYMQTYVAIKLINDGLPDSVDVRAEVDILKSLKHRNIPMIMDYVENEGQIYTVMEYITGKNLQNYMDEGRYFTEAEICSYMVQLCDAVEYLHSHQPPIIHSDIKPANIMLADDGTICLIDFNISRLADRGKASSYGGSRGFAAPEQFRQVINVPDTVEDFHEATRFMSASETTMYGRGTGSNTAFVDIRTDIYGIGSTIFYLLTGKIPKNGVVNISGYNFSPSVKKIIIRSTASDPSKRYQNVEQMKLDLLKAKKSARTTVITAIIGDKPPHSSGFKRTARRNTANSTGTNVSEPHKTEIVDIHETAVNSAQQRTALAKQSSLKVIVPATVSAMCIIATVAIIVTDRENTIANTDVIV